MVVAVMAVEVVAASMVAVVEAVGSTVAVGVAALTTAVEEATALLVAVTAPPVAAQTIIPARRITIPVLPDPTVHTAAAQRIPIAQPDAPAAPTMQATAQA
jgi:hypothetical protein